VIKLRKLISERKFGEPLPTLKSEMEKHQKLKERRGDTQKYSYKVIEPIKRDWVQQYRKMNERWMKKNMKKIRDYASKEHGRDIYLTGKGKEDFQKVYNPWLKACQEFEHWLDQLQSIPLDDK
jgi:hypothetical protein